MTTIQDIFREIQPEGSFSMARKQIALAGVKFNGEQITSMTQEVDVKEGSTFQVLHHGWKFYLWIGGEGWKYHTIQRNEEPEPKNSIVKKLDIAVTALSEITKLGANPITKHGCTTRADFIRQVKKMWYVAFEALYQIDEEREGEMPANQANPKWESNMIQFPRLICEIVATQENLDIQALADSMDLEASDVNELFERANVAWERAKAEIKT